MTVLVALLEAIKDLGTLVGTLLGTIVGMITSSCQ